MTWYSVLAVTPTNQDWVPAYVRATNDLVMKHGGIYLARTASHEQLEGAPETAGLRVIIAWPSHEAAKAFMADPDYAAHLKARTAGSTSLHFLIEGEDDLA
ncbi:MAG: DUF1330 domain-containing protein [Pseudomonadota bacterium]